MPPDTFPALAAQAAPELLGEPDWDAGRCELCGHDADRRVAWRPKGNWTAHATHAYPGEGAICLGCDLLVNGRCPDAGPSGKPMRWTLLTIATDGARLWWATKADKRTIRRWVDDEGISVSVADGGKKHIAYLAPVARPGRVRVAIDGQHVDLPSSEWAELADTVQDAYRAGVPKGVLETGRLGHNAYRLLGVDRADRLQRLLDRYRSTSGLRLAVWLAQPKEEQ